MRMADREVHFMSYKSKTTSAGNDPIVGAFLSFLEADMAANATAITPIDLNTIRRAKALIAGITVTDDELD
jgi:hypothetical protein